VGYDASAGDYSTGEMQHEAEAAPGVFTSWDPFRPDDLQVRDGLPREIVDGGPGSPAMQAWIRLAALQALDLRLQLPLSKALLLAESSAAKTRARATLPQGSKLAKALDEESFRDARRASPGVTRYLHGLAQDGDPLPEPLAYALAGVASAYLQLAEECVGVDVDVDLTAVQEAWRAVEPLGTVGRVGDLGTQATSEASPLTGAQYFLDPTIIPARVLTFSSRADVPDVQVSPGPDEDSPVVRLQAFDDDPQLDAIAGMDVRIIHSTTREVLAFYPLAAPSRVRSSARPLFETIVEIPSDVPMAALCFDVQGLSSGYGRAASADDVTRGRRAFFFLAAWRALAADVRLAGAAARPATRLRDIADAASHGEGLPAADAPLWRGGPSLVELENLAGLGDARLAALLEDGDASGILRMVSGHGDLLVAELAAAHARRATADRPPESPAARL
jgi:hypothetical protein